MYAIVKFDRKIEHSPKKLNATNLDENTYKIMRICYACSLNKITTHTNCTSLKICLMSSLYLPMSNVLSNRLHRLHNTSPTPDILCSSKLATCFLDVAAVPSAIGVSGKAFHH